MSYPKPRGYKIPKDVIESTSNINKKEAVFTKKKDPFSKLKQIGINREKNSVDYYSGNVKDRLYHTHVQSIDEYYFMCMPSVTDLISYYKQRKKNNIPIQGIFIIDEKTGKNIGRTFFTFTNNTEKIIDTLYKRYKKFISKNEDDSLIKELLFTSDSSAIKILTSNVGSNVFQKKQILFQLFLNKKMNDNQSERRRYDILTKDLGIKIRFVPMPGYKFNKETFRFEKK
ncbi:MAG TPA: hypothetical protein PKK56_02550 [archaeon]|mgnify:FL=1|jgi:hypothetical protein|nr:hypothetical protein [archaeon]HRT03715.1 hypothetical protein [Candidatus Diapherotrites archaeon]